MNNKYKILESKKIPYWENRELRDQIKESSERRGLNKIQFIFRKSRIVVLTWLAYYCPVNKWRVKLNKWKGVNMGAGVFIGPACILEFAYPEYIYIEDNVGIAGNVQILTHTNPNKHFQNLFESKVAPVIIKEGAWITVGCTILPGVTIGLYSVITCGSVVSNNIPDHAIARGNPAKVISIFKSL